MNWIIFGFIYPFAHILGIKKIKDGWKWYFSLSKYRYFGCDKNQNKKRKFFVWIIIYKLCFCNANISNVLCKDAKTFPQAPPLLFQPLNSLPSFPRAQKRILSIRWQGYFFTAYQLRWSNHWSYKVDQVFGSNK